ncbi:MAG: sortase [Candidatus Roizmanbacteria bacterium]|nr:MAG: sortase [Candidatus Roizmanbacteria bacterium]
MIKHVYIKEYYSVKKRMTEVISYISLVTGAILLFWSFYPIVSFEIYSRLFIQRDVLSPIPRSQLAFSLNTGGSVLGSYQIYSSNLRDFVQANLWFPTMSQTNTPSNIEIKEYYLTIPKLNIADAKVIVGGNDLSKSLIHYIPTTLPGEYGNVNIFGHSSLPQLYNSKDYKTLFTYLPSIEKGDKVIIKIGSIKYEYEAYDMFVVKPDQVSVLEQRYDAAYLTLITCVPPGTYWNRLVVKAKLSKI